MSGRFATTRWSVVIAAGGTGSQASQALTTLCQAYWHPIYAYLRRTGRNHETALDLTQEFFTRTLERCDVAKADPNRGRFRSFLLHALKRFLANDHAYRIAAKRDERKLVWLDGATAAERYRLEPRQDLDPERLFDCAWALTLLQRCVDRLEHDCVSRGRGPLFAQVRPWLNDTPDPGAYDAVASTLGMKPNAVRVAVFGLRRRLTDLIVQETSESVERAADVPLEIELLLSALRPRKAA